MSNGFQYIIIFQIVISPSSSRTVVALRYLYLLPWTNQSSVIYWLKEKQEIVKYKDKYVSSETTRKYGFPERYGYKWQKMFDSPTISNFNIEYVSKILNTWRRGKNLRVFELKREKIKQRDGL